MDIGNNGNPERRLTDGSGAPQIPFSKGCQITRLWGLVLIGLTALPDVGIFGRAPKRERAHAHRLPRRPVSSSEGSIHRTGPKSSQSTRTSSVAPGGGFRVVVGTNNAMVVGLDRPGGSSRNATLL